MKLIYRGVEYSNNNPEILTLKEIAGDRGVISHSSVNPKFPLIKYVKQLFSNSESKPIFDPLTFWDNQKTKFLENCFLLDVSKQLEYCWNLTLKREREAKTNSDRATKVKLKYRGVTYYR